MAWQGWPTSVAAAGAGSPRADTSLSQEGYTPRFSPALREQRHPQGCHSPHHGVVGLVCLRGLVAPPTERAYPLAVHLMARRVRRPRRTEGNATPLALRRGSAVRGWHHVEVCRIGRQGTFGPFPGHGDGLHNAPP